MTLEITVVGLDIDDYVRLVVMKRRQYINKINSVKYGRLGNFRTVIHSYDLVDQKSMETRRDILKELSLPEAPTIGMYEHGAPEKVYIFRKTAFKKDEDE